MPPGMVNIVTGNGMPAGDAIVRHPRVKRIAFTGSVPTGMAIQRAAAEGGIKALSLELGGKNPFIVYPDADADKVADAAIAGMNFAWSGQSCGSTSRLMLHEYLYKKVLDRVTEKVAEIKIGDPMDPKSQMGPVNSKRHMERVNMMIKSGIDDGAKLMIGGKRPPGKQFERGFWIEPTVFGDVHPQMKIAREEIFGPVLSVFSWRDEDAIIELANSLEYGLTAAVWTNDIKRALKAARRVQSGWSGSTASAITSRARPTAATRIRRRQGKLPRGALELHRGKVDPDFPRGAIRHLDGRGASAIRYRQLWQPAMSLLQTPGAARAPDCLRSRFARKHAHAQLVQEPARPIWVAQKQGSREAGHRGQERLHGRTHLADGGADQGRVRHGHHRARQRHRLRRRRGLAAGAEECRPHRLHGRHQWRTQPDCASGDQEYQGAQGLATLLSTRSRPAIPSCCRRSSPRTVYLGRLQARAFGNTGGRAGIDAACRLDRVSAAAQAINLAERPRCSGGYQGTVVATRRDYAKSNADTVVGFIRAYRAGLEWPRHPPTSRRRSRSAARSRHFAAGEAYAFLVANPKASTRRQARPAGARPCSSCAATMARRASPRPMSAASWTRAISRARTLSPRGPAARLGRRIAFRRLFPETRRLTPLGRVARPAAGAPRQAKGVRR